MAPVLREIIVGYKPVFLRSKLWRVVQTSELALPGASWIDEVNLSERHWGDAENKVLHPDEVRYIIERATTEIEIDYGQPGGETLREVYIRLKNALSLLQRDRLRVIESHGESISLIMRIIEEIPISQAPLYYPDRLVLSNGCVVLYGTKHGQLYRCFKYDRTSKEWTPVSGRP